MSISEQIKKALDAVFERRGDDADTDFDDGCIGAYEHCLSLLAQHEQPEVKAYSDLEAAATAIIEMECERINGFLKEPYDPIANPGRFDPRVVALAKLVWK